MKTLSKPLFLLFFLFLLGKTTLYAQNQTQDSDNNFFVNIQQINGVNFSEITTLSVCAGDSIEVMLYSEIVLAGQSLSFWNDASARNPTNLLGSSLVSESMMGSDTVVQVYKIEVTADLLSTDETELFFFYDLSFFSTTFFTTGGSFTIGVSGFSSGPVDFSILEVTNASCSSARDGAIKVRASHTEPFVKSIIVFITRLPGASNSEAETFAINFGTFSQNQEKEIDLTTLPAASYTFEYGDEGTSCNFKHPDTIVVNARNASNVEALITNAACGSNKGAISLQIREGNGSNYSLLNLDDSTTVSPAATSSSSFAIFENLASGNYQFNYSNGTCDESFPITGSLTVGEDAERGLVLMDIPTQTVCEGSDISLNLSASGLFEDSRLLFSILDESGVEIVAGTQNQTTLIIPAGAISTGTTTFTALVKDEAHPENEFGCNMKTFTVTTTTGKGLNIFTTFDESFTDADSVFACEGTGIQFFVRLDDPTDFCEMQYNVIDLNNPFSTTVVNFISHEEVVDLGQLLPSTYLIIAQKTCTQQSACSVNSDTVVYTVYSTPTLDVQELIATTICQGQSVTLTAFTTGGAPQCENAISWTYQAVEDAPVAFDGNPLILPNDLPAGNYQLTASLNCTDVIGCNDASLTIDLNISEITTTELTEIICEGESISVGNNAYTDAGMYSDTLQSISGCDSIVNLNLTVNPSFSMTLTETICEGESITIGNTTFTTSGNFTERLNTVNGCDSIINLSLTVVPSFEDNIEETICEGDSIVIGSSIYKADGSYSDTLQNVFGCDSIINLRLFVNPTFNRSINQSICTGDSIILGNQVLKETGVYTESFLSSNGCDSVVTIDLFVNPFINTVVDSTICEGEVIFIGDSSYSESGTYEQVFTAVGGCDSIFTLNVTVLPIYNINLNEVICEGDSVQVGNSIYNSSGNYVDTLCSVSDCDSIVNLSLLVHPSFDETIETIVCEGETVRVGNRTYTEIGNYIDTLQTVLGCDSIIRLNLTVNPTYVIDREQTICEGQAITIGEEIIETAGSYEILLQTINGCDSLINLEVKLAAEINTILNEIICEGGSIMVGETQYTTAGAYVDTLTASGGCDSIVSLFLQVIGPANQAAIATEDQSTCDAETLISAIEYSELPIAGEWRSTGGQFIVDPFSSETEVGDFNVGENIFIWSLTSEACGFDPYSTDTVVVNFDRIPIANDDEFITRRETPSLNQSIIENDILPEDWRIEFFEVPEEITVTEQDGLINIFPQDEFTGEVEFGYRLCSEACDTCDEATILVAINKNADPDSPPSYLCPTCPNPVPFEPVPCLPDCYQNDVNSIVIVNRWGDVVYEEKPFSGTWFGNNAQGVPLPAGTYYYIIRLDLGNAEILVGEIIILR